MRINVETINILQSRAFNDYLELLDFRVVDELDVGIMLKRPDNAAANPTIRNQIKRVRGLCRVPFHGYTVSDFFYR